MLCPTEAGSQHEDDITMAMLLAPSLSETLLQDKLMLATTHHLHAFKVQSNGVLETYTHGLICDNTQRHGRSEQNAFGYLWAHPLSTVGTKARLEAAL